MERLKYLIDNNILYQKLKLCFIIPVACTCIKVFFKLSIVKHKLRINMDQDRLKSILFSVKY